MMSAMRIGDFRSALLAFLIVSAPLHAEEMPAGFIDAAYVVEGLVVDMRYYGSNNFVGEPIDGYESPRCLLTHETAKALAEVQHYIAEYGYGLKVFDCYRPARAVAHFVRWAEDVDDTTMKDEVYPEIDKRDLFRLGYIAERSGHSRGSTVDVTLVTLEDGSEIDMGTPFDFFSTKSWPSDTTVADDQRANRMLLADAMTRHGFKPLQEEWWHFTLADEPYPDTYFDFPIR
jgi:zinc D-Ala-D-Ala dipeptidase